MITYKYKALNADGSQTEGVVEAESSQQAIRKVKEQGLFPLTIEAAALGIDEMSSASTIPEDLNEVKHIHSFGWKIRFRKVLVFYVPLLIVAAICNHFFFIKPSWYIFPIMIVSLFLFGFAGSFIEAMTLGSFVCPQCKTTIRIWSLDSKRRIIYDCSQCGVKWDIGYKQRSGRYG